MENPLSKQARLMHQNTMPSGSEILRSIVVGEERKWKDTVIAEETTAR
jgi:hypothetical protein